MMDIVAPTALVVAILYVLSRWNLSAVEQAAAHPDKGHPAVTWKVSWYIALVVSLLGAASVHVWLLAEAALNGKVMAFNLLIFGGFLIGFFVSGHWDHKVRLGLRGGE